MPKKAPLPVGRDFEKRVLSLFQRKQRHVLVGEVSLETGYSLNTVEYHLVEIEIRGAIRRLEYAEKKRVGLHDLAEAYLLIDPSLFTLGE
jgi:hypothetical protein